MTAVKWYVRITKPDHPRADKRRRVRRSVLVMEAHIDRFLLLEEEVHHINGILTDDRIENLELVSCKEHQRRYNNLAEYNSKPRNTKGRPFYGNQYRKAN
mgnify:CR=1 FL=1